MTKAFLNFLFDIYAKRPGLHSWTLLIGKNQTHLSINSTLNPKFKDVSIENPCL